MALLQVKHHGEVSNHKAPSMVAAARRQRELHTEMTVRQGFTLVGSYPGTNLYVCAQHSDSLPEGADFCYITSVSSGRAGSDI